LAQASEEARRGEAVNQAPLLVINRDSEIFINPDLFDPEEAIRCDGVILILHSVDLPGVSPCSSIGQALFYFLILRSGGAHTRSDDLFRSACHHLTRNLLGQPMVMERRPVADS